MTRRFFLRALALGAAAAALDPEQLLWTPGQRTHFLPPADGWRTLRWGSWQDVGLGYIGWDPASEAAADARYVFVREDLSVNEFRSRYLEPAMRERFNRAEAEMLAQIRKEEDLAFLRGEQWPTFQVHPLSARDRDTAEVLQGIVNRVAQTPEVRAAIDDQIRHEVRYGGRRAGKRTQLEARVRAATMARIYDDVSTPGAPPNVVIDLTKDLP